MSEESACQPSDVPCGTRSVQADSIMLTRTAGSPWPSCLLLDRAAILPDVRKDLREFDLFGASARITGLGHRPLEFWYDVQLFPLREIAGITACLKLTLRIQNFT